MGTQYKESCTVLLPEQSVSTISIGQSCYIYFAPAVRVFTNLKLQPSIDGEEVEGEKKTGGSAVAKRFPKIWSRAIMDVFVSSGVNELTQISLIEQFKSLHQQAVSSFFSESQGDLDDELWSYLKRFVTKTPFEFDAETTVVRFDPQSVKPRAPPASKKPKVGSSDGEDVAPPNEAISID